VTYQKIGQVGFHAIVHDTQFGAEPIYILSTIGLERFQIEAVLMQHVQQQLLHGESMFVLLGLSNGGIL
jgi:hypothetical protein